MVDSITPVATRAQLPQQGTSNDFRSHKGQGKDVAPPSRTEAVEISVSAAVGMTSELSSEPPFDVDKVNRIREAVMRGEYPISPDVLSEKLVTAFTEMAD